MMFFYVKAINYQILKLPKQPSQFVLALSELCTLPSEFMMTSLNLKMEEDFAALKISVSQGCNLAHCPIWTLGFCLFVIFTSNLLQRLFQVSEDQPRG
jgi:hypothetical protein